MREHSGCLWNSTEAGVAGAERGRQVAAEADRGREAHGGPSWPRRWLRPLLGGKAFPAPVSHGLRVTHRTPVTHTHRSTSRSLCPHPGTGRRRLLLRPWSPGHARSLLLPLAPKPPAHGAHIIPPKSTAVVKPPMTRGGEFSDPACPEPDQCQRRQPDRPVFSLAPRGPLPGLRASCRYSCPPSVSTRPSPLASLVPPHAATLARLLCAPPSDECPCAPTPYCSLLG